MAKPVLLAVVALAAVIPWLARAQDAGELAGSAAAPDVMPSDGSVSPLGLISELREVFSPWEYIVSGLGISARP